MANFYGYQFPLTYEADTVTIFGNIVVGASGAVASFQGGGVFNVVKESTAGQYSITLLDRFSRFLSFDACVIDDAVTQIAQIQILEAGATFQADIAADKTFKIQCLAVESDATPVLIAANPADTAVINFKVVMRNSTVGVYDA